MGKLLFLRRVLSFVIGVVVGGRLDFFSIDIELVVFISSVRRGCYRFFEIICSVLAWIWSGSRLGRWGLVTVVVKARFYWVLDFS